MQAGIIRGRPGTRSSNARSGLGSAKSSMASGARTGPTSSSCTALSTGVWPAGEGPGTQESQYRRCGHEFPGGIPTACSGVPRGVKCAVLGGRSQRRLRPAGLAGRSVVPLWIVRSRRP